MWWSAHSIFWRIQCLYWAWSICCHTCLGTVRWRSFSVLQDPEDAAVHVGQRRAWCWCMCFGLAFMLAGVILGGAYLYKYFAFQVSQNHFPMGWLCFSLLCLTFRREKRSNRLNQIALLLTYISFQNLSFSKGKVLLLALKLLAGRDGQEQSWEIREQLFWKPYFAEKGLYLNRTWV